MPPSSALRALNERLQQSSHLYFIVVAIVIGLLGGYGAVGFRYLLQALQRLFWQTDDFSVATISELPWFVIVSIPALGGMVVGLIVRYVASEARGSGVPEIMVAVARNQGRIRPRIVLAKIFSSGITIGSGGSVGREGPVAHIGAAIASTIGQLLRIDPRRLRTLVGCGAAAGIAATFNAPIAGAMFAVEVILGDFGVTQFSPIVIAAVTATVVSRTHLGDLPAFDMPEYAMNHPQELFGYAAMGLLAGLVAVALIRGIFWTETRFDGLRLPIPVRTGLGGALLGTFALVEPGVLGVGYETINRTLNETPELAVVLVLLVAKLIAVCLSLGSGGSGGVVAPALFLGASLGAAIGIGCAAIAPATVAAPSAYALVGMGAVLAAVTHAPITAILTVFELTGEYQTILPLMTACILANMFARRLSPESAYTLKLKRRGIEIRSGQDITLLRDVQARDVLREDCARAQPDDPLPVIVHAAAEGPSEHLYVVDGDRRLVGVVPMEDLRSVVPEVGVLRHLVLASEITRDEFPSVSPNQTLDSVLDLMQLRFVDEVPVVDAGGRLRGIVRLVDVLKAASLGANE